MGSKIHFAYEDLEVWHKAIELADIVLNLIEDLKTDRNHYRLVEQLESCVTSVAMNVAEGKGRFSKKEYVQFLYIARGSLFETMTLLEILKRRNWIDNYQYRDIRLKSNDIGKMLSGLIASIKNPKNLTINHHQ